jgi:very-short-patch-repair endonuclease
MAKRISILEMRALNIIDKNRFKGYVCELRFHPERMWRFDFAFEEQKIAIELEGGIWNNGAHTRGSHFNSDCEKYNEATILGWKVLRYTTDTIQNIPKDLLRLGIKNAE